jgi:hypothetical protein
MRVSLVWFEGLIDGEVVGASFKRCRPVWPLPVSSKASRGGSLVSRASRRMFTSLLTLLCYRLVIG